jgi:bisphosphoglycerate-independent phosphoglycerate mutase (AlkP superfamily)
VAVRHQRVNYGMDTTGEKKKRMSKKNMDGKSTSSHDNKKFRISSVEKQGGVVFGFWKTATAVTKPDR